VLLAQIFHSFPNKEVIVPGHRGEQVMFDLVVEVASEPVVEGAWLHVLGGFELGRHPVI
jgi:hypothetical protein